MKILLLTIGIWISLIAMENQNLYKGIVVIEKKAGSEVLSSIPKIIEPVYRLTSMTYTFKNMSNMEFSQFRNILIQEKHINQNDMFTILYMKNQRLNVAKIEETISIKTLADQFEKLFFISESIIKTSKEKPEIKKELYNYLWKTCCEQTQS